jgi:beta-glucosidase/6-phospho-beta-glucosidase/beta-galactosidase
LHIVSSHAEVASDDYPRYKEDVQLMKDVAPNHPTLRILQDDLFNQPMEKCRG